VANLKSGLGVPRGVVMPSKVVDPAKKAHLKWVEQLKTSSWARHYFSFSEFSKFLYDKGVDNTFNVKDAMKPVNCVMLAELNPEKREMLLIEVPAFLELVKVPRSLLPEVKQ
jgi:hypothetical protein